MMEQREDSENDLLIIALGDFLQKLWSFQIPSRKEFAATGHILFVSIIYCILPMKQHSPSFMYN